MNRATYTIKIKDLTEMAIFSAMAIILDRFVKIPIGATGGSINLSVIPLIVIILRHGWFKGFLSAGIIFGFSSCLLDGYGIQFYPLEYLLAYGFLAIIGIFSKYIYKNYLLSKSKTILCYIYLVFSIIVWTLIRFLLSSIDSVIFYQYSFKEAFIYNFAYVFITSGFILAFACGLLPVITRINKKYKTFYLKQNSHQN